MITSSLRTFDVRWLVGALLLGCIAAPAARAEGQPSTAPGIRFRQLPYEKLQADTWKMLRVGASNEQVDFPAGRSYFAAVELPAASGGLELRTQTPLSMSRKKKSVLPNVTFLDCNFRITHTATHEEVRIPQAGAFRPMENPLLEMKVEKRPADRYMLVHSDPRIVGTTTRIGLGNRGSTTIVTGTFTYSAPNPESLDVIAVAKGNVRVKLFTGAR